MKIVIEIPRYIAALCVENNISDPIDIETLTQAIKNGIPLPEHHGRLIDADAYKETWFNSRQFEPMLLLDEAPTIIEADKAESEEA